VTFGVSSAFLRDAVNPPLLPSSMAGDIRTVKRLRTPIGAGITQIVTILAKLPRRETPQIKRAGRMNSGPEGEIEK
jgi:hypothetical protein